MLLLLKRLYLLTGFSRRLYHQRNIRRRYDRYPQVFSLAHGLPQASPKWTGKSIWAGRDGEDVTVEILALQYYESKGYKG